MPHENTNGYVLTLRASDHFCHLLVTIANSLDPDQARQDVGPGLDPNCFTLMVLSKDLFLKNVDFEKISTQQKKT